MDIFKVSRLGFGTSQIGGPLLVSGRPYGARPIPKKEAMNILKYAFENGINFFDTSDKYGNAEGLLGAVFSRKRNKVVIATKCGITDEGDRKFNVSYINRCLEGSLRRLGTDYVDIFQLAKPSPEDLTDELIGLLERKVAEGKIRHFGVSVFGAEDGACYMHKRIVKSLQIFYNLLFTESHELIKQCAENNKFVIVRSPLNSGLLSGRYSLNTRFHKIDPRGKIFRGDLLRERLENIDKVKKHFDLLSSGLLRFALNFVFSNKNINTVIPAASRMSQLRDYLNVYNHMRRIDREETERILRYLRTKIKLRKEGQFT